MNEPRRTKRAKTSPMQRSLKMLRDRGYVVAITERWNPHARISQDLWGWIDLLALDPVSGEIIAVQTTSGSNVSSRLSKVKSWKHLGAWLLRHRAVVHGWAKRGPRGEPKQWDCREIEVTAPGPLPQRPSA